jgi:TetR/AcrR family transcriptional regulator, transcriptional repressor for nem operon
MRKSRAEAARTRERIVSGASAMFRESGLADVSVAALMANAGLTHGGFYSHFESREALVAEALRFALVQSAQRIYLSELRNGDKPGYSRLIRKYLSRAHRDDPKNGCVLASLAAEVARQEGASRSVFTRGFDELVTLLADLSPARTRNARRAHVLAVISALAGALTLARAVSDPLVSEEILVSVRKSLLADELRRNERRTRQGKRLARA